MLAACEYKERVQAASAIITRDGITDARAGAFIRAFFAAVSCVVTGAVVAGVHALCHDLESHVASCMRCAAKARRRAGPRRVRTPTVL